MLEIHALSYRNYHPARAAAALAAAMTPFGSLPSDGAALAAAMVEWSTGHDLDVGSRALRLVRMATTSECSSLLLGDGLAQLRTPTSRTLIEVGHAHAGYGVGVDFGGGSQSRALEILLAAERAQVRFVVFAANSAEVDRASILDALRRRAVEHAAWVEHQASYSAEYRAAALNRARADVDMLA